MQTVPCVMRNLFLLVLFSSVWVTPQISRADLVYQFVDHPADQNGYTLSGSITTTDAAPLDGILQSNEILAWNWIASGGPNPTGASSSDLNAILLVDDVSISATQITLDEPNVMSGDLFAFSLGGDNGRLTYARSEDGFGGYLETYESPGSWVNSQPGMTGTDPWLIATAVQSIPEPGSFWLVGTALIGLRRMRRSR